MNTPSSRLACVVLFLVLSVLLSHMEGSTLSPCSYGPCGRKLHQFNNPGKLCSCDNGVCPTTHDSRSNRSVRLIDYLTITKPRNDTYYFCTDTLLKNRPFYPNGTGYALYKISGAGDYGKTLASMIVDHRCSDDVYYLTETRRQPETGIEIQFYQCLEQKKCEEIVTPVTQSTDNVYSGKKYDFCLVNEITNYKGGNYSTHEAVQCLCPGGLECSNFNGDGETTSCWKSPFTK